MITTDEKGISVRRLKTFLTNLKDMFALKDHSHTTVNGHTVNSDVPSDAKFTDTTYSDATTSAHGLMTADMVAKLNSITSDANMKYKQITQEDYTSLGSSYEKGTVYFIND